MGPWCESGMTTGVADVHLPCRRAEEALWGNRESFSSVLEAVSRVSGSPFSVCWNQHRPRIRMAERPWG